MKEIAGNRDEKSFRLIACKRDEQEGEEMEFSDKSNLTALSALKRSSSAPHLVTVAPSGSGKSTLIYLLLNQRFSSHIRIGIGEKSQTTMIPCEFCLDERIKDEESFAIQIIKKDYSYKDIQMSISTILMELFGKNKYDVKKTIETFDEKVLENVLEPKEAHYHLGRMKNEISLDDLKDVLSRILDYMAEHDFEEKVSQRRDELKSKKVKLSAVKEIVFEELFDEIPENIKTSYAEWLEKLGQKIDARLEKEIGPAILEQEMIQYRLNDDRASHVLEELFDPKAPYSLVIDHISIACRPRQELIDTARIKSPKLPCRFCIRDTMGLTQKGMDAADMKDALEVALNYKADAILFLLSLEERDDILSECCRSLMEKKKELMGQSHFNIPVYVLFTKADRKVDNLINKYNTGGLYIDEHTYSENIQEILDELEGMVSSYADGLPQEEVGWVSMRYNKDSCILKSLEGNERKNNFEPAGLFSKVVNYSIKTLRYILQKNIKDPLSVTAIDPASPVIQVSVDPKKIKNEIAKMQNSLCNDPGIVAKYDVSKISARFHWKSVSTYWNKLTNGSGHTTKASVYGNFSINMKKLLEGILKDVFASFAKFTGNSAVAFSADNLGDAELMSVSEALSNNSDIELGLNPAIGNRNIALQRLYEFYVEYFMNESRFKTLTSRVAFDLSYGNSKIKQCLTTVYNKTFDYDSAMRKLQCLFGLFFDSNDFEEILISEFNQIMTEMANKIFIVI